MASEASHDDCYGSGELGQGSEAGERQAQCVHNLLP